MCVIFVGDTALCDGPFASLWLAKRLVCMAAGLELGVGLLRGNDKFRIYHIWGTQALHMAHKCEAACARVAHGLCYVSVGMNLCNFIGSDLL